MVTRLGPKYIPYTYMDPLGYKKSREKESFETKPGLTCEEICLCAEALIASYVSNLVPFKSVDPWYFTKLGIAHLREKERDAVNSWRRTLPCSAWEVRVIS